MTLEKPKVQNVVRDDYKIGSLLGGRGNDHLIHHRSPDLDAGSNTTLASFAGDDILEASVPDRGQIHMYGSTGNDWFILDVTKLPDARGMQGHHAYGGHGRDVFQFVNVENNHAPIFGRLDDFDPTSDTILINETEIDLTKLPQQVALNNGETILVRVIEVIHPEFEAENLGKQYYLAIGDNIFYALEGARDLVNGTSDSVGEERHFLLPSALEHLRSAETVQYINPKNFVPREFYEHREHELNLNWGPRGEEVFADIGSKEAADVYGTKQHSDDAPSTGAQVMHGSDGDDVINANTGNDTIFGGHGNDLIAGGIDNDVIYGGPGDDMIWGGDGNDSLYGEQGNDYLHGGRGDDLLVGGQGNDTLVGGRGNNTLVGGGEEFDVNRFHFFEDEGHDIITDFKPYSDLITIQEEVDPSSLKIFENEGGNTVIRFGEEKSIELLDISLEIFKDAAETRADLDNPIITITPDPETEILHELRLSIGYYVDADAPSIFTDSILYGAKAFNQISAGGYNYLDEVSDDDKNPGDDAGEEDDSEKDELVLEGPEQKPIPIEEKDEEDQVSGADSSCFVATAAYRDPWHPDVVFLRAFRDDWLAKRRWGRTFITFYWFAGPKLARLVRKSELLANTSKMLISQIVGSLRLIWDINEGKQK